MPVWPVVTWLIMPETGFAGHSETGAMPVGKACVGLRAQSGGVEYLPQPRQKDLGHRSP